MRAHYAALWKLRMQGPPRRFYLHEMPGGQFTKPQGPPPQARSMGLEDRWHEVAQMYADVNQMFGDIVKVTPGPSKVVGDMGADDGQPGALTREDVENPAKDVSFPDSVTDMMRALISAAAGRLSARHPEEGAQGRAARARPARQACGPCRSGGRAHGAGRSRLEEKIDDEDLMGYMMYPKVFSDYAMRHKEYGPVRTLPTRTFFYGMEPGEEIEAEIDPGVRLVRAAAGHRRHQRGRRGPGLLRAQRPAAHDPGAQPARSPRARSSARRRRWATQNHIRRADAWRPWPPSRSRRGQKVAQGDLLLTIEAMKMETGLHAERDALVKAVHVDSRRADRRQGPAWSSW